MSLEHADLERLHQERTVKTLGTWISGHLHDQLQNDRLAVRAALDDQHERLIKTLREELETLIAPSLNRKVSVPGKSLDELSEEPDVPSERAPLEIPNHHDSSLEDVFLEVDDHNDRHANRNGKGCGNQDVFWNVSVSPPGDTGNESIEDVWPDANNCAARVPNGKGEICGSQVKETHAGQTPHGPALKLLKQLFTRSEKSEDAVSKYRQTEPHHKDQYKTQHLELTSKRLHHIVASSWFEACSALLIILTMAVGAWHEHVQGTKVGANLGYPGYQKEPGRVDESFFKLLEHIFVGGFALELLIRLLVMKKAACASFWIWFDSTLLVFALMGEFHFTSIDPSMMRLARLMRIARAVRLLRAFNQLDSMFLLLRSLEASAGALFWSFILLFCVQVAIGMLLCQILRGFFQSESSLAVKHSVYEYFGDLLRTMLTMFQITFANWVPVTRLLVENVSPWLGVFLVMYRCMFCFAIVKVIAAVFISETNRVVQTDNEAMMVKAQRQQHLYQEKLLEMFRELDQSNDGYISADEFKQLIDDEQLKTWSNALDLRISQLMELFDFLDDGDGKISVHEFVQGMPKIKGNAQSTDLLHLVSLMRKMHAKVDKLSDALDPKPDSRS